MVKYDPCSFQGFRERSNDSCRKGNYMTYSIKKSVLRRSLSRFLVLTCCLIKSFLTYFDWNISEWNDRNSDCEYFV